MRNQRREKRSPRYLDISVVRVSSSVSSTYGRTAARARLFLLFMVGGAAFFVGLRMGCMAGERDVVVAAGKREVMAGERDALVVGEKDGVVVVVGPGEEERED